MHPENETVTPWQELGVKFEKFGQELQNPNARMSTLVALAYDCGLNFEFALFNNRQHLTTNEEFRELTTGMSQPEIVAALNDPEGLVVKLGSVKAWLADPDTTYFRNLPQFKLDAFRSKLSKE